MNDTVWYYVDRGGQRQGPVTAAAVAEAWRDGHADDTSLVWREGLAEWMPLAGLRDELGLAGEPASSPAALPAPSPSAPAYTAPPSPLPSPRPAGPSGSNKGCLIAGIVGGVVILFVIGILAAIALPAYQEYVERSKELAEDTAAAEEGGEAAGEALPPGSMDSDLLAMALAEARQHQALVDDFVANTDRCPRDPSEVAVPPAVTPGVVAITVGEARTGMCTIEVELGGAGAESLAGERLTLSRDIAGDWYCTSELAARDSLPAECR